MNIDLNNAFPPMTDLEAAALMDTARSMQEEERPMKRKLPRGMLIAAIVLLMMTTVALAEGLGLLDALFTQMDVTVLPGIQTQKNVLQVENEDCIFTIREAAFDGYGGSVIIDIRAKDEKTLLTRNWGWSLEEKAAEVLHVDDAGDMTLAEYAEAKGYERVIIADVQFPPSLSDDAWNLSSVSTRVSEYHGSTATILCTFPTKNGQIKDRVLTQEYDFYTSPRVCELPVLAADIQAMVSHCTGTFDISLAVPLWTRKAMMYGGHFFGTQLDVKSVTLTGTQLGMYMKVEYEVDDRDATAYYFSLADEDGEVVPDGMLSSGDHEYHLRSQRNIYSCSFQAQETPPESGKLWLLIHRRGVEKPERMLLILTDK